MQQKFSAGVWPVVLTPFLEDGSIDYSGYGTLLEHYLQNGVTGLFAVCLSSEMFQLSPAERLELARFTVRHTAGRVPVVGCGGFGKDFSAKVRSVKEMADTGIDAVVIPASVLVPPETSQEGFRDDFLRLLDATGTIKLGLYECPMPYHRLISPSILGELARVAGERLPFLKDTCCDRVIIRQKLEACRGTGLAFYNANLTTFLDSLRAGAQGYSGTSANFYPELLSEMCRIFQSEPEKAERLQQFFNLIQRHVEFQYPRAAKHFLAMRGVPITAFCRVSCPEFNGEQLEQMRALYQTLLAFEEDF